MNPSNFGRTALGSLFVAALVIAASGCVHGRYTLPVSPYDAVEVYPSVVSVAQQQGHQAWLNGNNLQVELKDGTHYWWYTQADGTVGLAIKFPTDVDPAQEQVRLASAKQIADQLWQEALAARQQYAPTPTATTRVVNHAPPPTDCQLGSDGQRVCGYDCKLSSRGHVSCASSPDGRCVLNSNGSVSCGRNCQLQANGFHSCF